MRDVDHLNDVRDCARCDGNHDRVQFFRFKQPFAPAELTVIWEFWGTCPTTGDPILVSLEYVPPEGELTP